MSQIQIFLRAARAKYSIFVRFHKGFSYFRGGRSISFGALRAQNIKNSQGFVRDLLDSMPPLGYFFPGWPGEDFYFLTDPFIINFRRPVHRRRKNPFSIKKDFIFITGIQGPPIGQKNRNMGSFSGSRGNTKIIRIKENKKLKKLKE